MRITAVSCLLCGARSPSGYHAGSALVRVETDAGLCGHGESLMGLFCGEAAAAIVRYYAPLLVGRDPADIDGLWQGLFASSIWWGRGGPAVSVLGAIEVALWDLAGQRAGKPCYQLLGERARDRVPVYASLGAAPNDLSELPALVGGLLAEGFRGLKIGLQVELGDGRLASPRGPELLERLDATLATLRGAAGTNFVIGVDGHMGGIPAPMAPHEALEVARVLERHDISFFEEPLSYREPAGYGWLRARTRVRIAGGRAWRCAMGSSPSWPRVAWTSCSPT